MKFSAFKWHSREPYICEMGKIKKANRSSPKSVEINYTTNRLKNQGGNGQPIFKIFAVNLLLFSG